MTDKQMRTAAIVAGAGLGLYLLTKPKTASASPSAHKPTPQQTAMQKDLIKLAKHDPRMYQQTLALLGRKPNRNELLGFAQALHKDYPALSKQLVEMAKKA